MKENFTEEEWDFIKEVDQNLDGNLVSVLQKYIHKGEWRKMPMKPNDYKIAYQADLLSDYEIGKILNNYAPNLTVCPRCHVDDFTHVEGCDLIDQEI